MKNMERVLKKYNLTQKEYTVLTILKQTYESNPDIYRFTKDIANDEKYLELEGLTNNYTMGCGNVNGALIKKGYLKFAVVLDGLTPIRCYQINKKGLDLLEAIEDEISNNRIRIQNEIKELEDKIIQLKSLIVS